jgi:hypothetical protein
LLNLQESLYHSHDYLIHYEILDKEFNQLIDLQDLLNRYQALDQELAIQLNRWQVLERQFGHCTQDDKSEHLGAIIEGLVSKGAQDELLKNKNVEMDDPYLEEIIHKKLSEIGTDGETLKKS